MDIIIMYISKLVLLLYFHINKIYIYIYNYLDLLLLLYFHTEQEKSYHYIQWCAMNSQFSIEIIASNDSRNRYNNDIESRE